MGAQSKQVGCSVTLGKLKLKLGGRMIVSESHNKPVADAVVCGFDLALQMRKLRPRGA